MDKAVLLKASGYVLGVDIFFQVDADVIRLALLVHVLLRNLGSDSVFFMTGHMIPGVGMLVNPPTGRGCVGHRLHRGIWDHGRLPSGLGQDVSRADPVLPRATNASIGLFDKTATVSRILPSSRKVENQ